jgi:hypothetical protein
MERSASKVNLVHGHFILFHPRPILQCSTYLPSVPRPVHPLLHVCHPVRFVSLFFPSSNSHQGALIDKIICSLPPFSQFMAQKQACGPLCLKAPCNPHPHSHVADYTSSLICFSRPRRFYLLFWSLALFYFGSRRRRRRLVARIPFWKIFFAFTLVRRAILFFGTFSIFLYPVRFFLA